MILYFIIIVNKLAPNINFPQNERSENNMES